MYVSRKVSIANFLLRYRAKLLSDFSSQFSDLEVVGRPTKDCIKISSVLVDPCLGKRPLELVQKVIVSIRFFRNSSTLSV